MWKAQLLQGSVNYGGPNLALHGAGRKSSGVPYLIARLMRRLLYPALCLEVVHEDQAPLERGHNGQVPKGEPTVMTKKIVRHRHHPLGRNSIFSS